MSPGWRQTIIWTNAGIFLIGRLGTNFSGILIEKQAKFQEIWVKDTFRKDIILLQLPGSSIRIWWMKDWKLLNRGTAVPGPVSEPLQWCHNERDGVSNHRTHDSLLNRLFRRRSKKTSKLRVTGLCEGNSPVPGGFSTQRASDTEKVSIGWHHYDATGSLTIVRLL